MSGSVPISSGQVVSILVKIAVRRFFNRWQALRMARKKAAPADSGKRTGTAGKSSINWIYPAFFFLIFTFNGFNFASRALAQLGHAVGAAQRPPGTLAVESYTYGELRQAEKAFQGVRQYSYDPKWQKFGKTWEQHLDEVFHREIQIERIPVDERADKFTELQSTFAKRGAAGFTVSSPEGFMGSADWPAANREPAFIRSVGLLTGLFVLATVMLTLGLSNKDLGQVEWSFEWLYAFPVSARALYMSKLLSNALLNPAVWMFLLPFLLYVFLISDWSGLGLGLALLSTAYYLLLSGSLALLVEVGARKFLSLGSLKNIQALCTVVGTLFLLSYLACGSSKSVAEFYAYCTSFLPDGILWQPFSVPTVLMARHVLPLSWLLALVSIFLWSFLALGSVFICERMTRAGLVRTNGPYQGDRKKRRSAARSSWLSGIPAKELRLLIRDRNIMVQVFVSPLIVIVFYLVTNSSILAAAQANFHHAATLAFCVGAYGLTSSAMQILNHEKGTLWQLYAFPRSLISILVELTLFWTAFAFLYATTVLLVLACCSRHLQASALVDGFIALYGVILYSFIASGIGALATNVLEDAPRARMRADMVYLYLLLIGMYAYTIYAPSIWAKLGQLVLSTLLGFALWQKVKDRLPYLLDPQASPPPSISLSDGLISVLAFFVMQGVVTLALMPIKSMPEAMKITLAYSGAGLCVASLTLYSLARSRIVGFWYYVGFVSSAYQSWSRAIFTCVAYGLIGGGIAALGAAIYLHALILVPSWEAWKEEAVSKSLLAREANHLWLYALAVIAAPLCEEFIFRGLVYRGLRRSLHPNLAILASAALFALVHPAVSVIPVFGLGIATAFCFEKTGLLLAPIFVHMTYNACVIFLNR